MRVTSHARATTSIDATFDDVSRRRLRERRHAMLVLPSLCQRLRATSLDGTGASSEKGQPPLLPSRAPFPMRPSFAPRLQPRTILRQTRLRLTGARPDLLGRRYYRSLLRVSRPRCRERRRPAAVSTRQAQSVPRRYSATTGASERRECCTSSMRRGRAAPSRRLNSAHRARSPPRASPEAGRVDAPLESERHDDPSSVRESH